MGSFFVLGPFADGKRMAIRKDMVKMVQEVDAVKTYVYYERGGNEGLFEVPVAAGLDQVLANLAEAPPKKRKSPNAQ